MDEERWEQFAELRDSALQTARAWGYKEHAMTLWAYRSRAWARKAWLAWYRSASRCRLEPVKRVARMNQAPPGRDRDRRRGQGDQRPRRVDQRGDSEGEVLSARIPQTANDSATPSTFISAALISTPSVSPSDPTLSTRIPEDPRCYAFPADRPSGLPNTCCAEFVGSTRVHGNLSWRWQTSALRPMSGVPRTLTQCVSISYSTLTEPCRLSQRPVGARSWRNSLSWTFPY